jgi:hypothetical protein
MPASPKALRCLAYGLGALFFTASTAAHPHGFGTPYMLPMPFWLYQYACAATLIVTFAAVAFRQKPGFPVRSGPSADAGFPLNRRTLMVLRLASVAGLCLTLIACIFGTQDPSANAGMLAFWVLFVLGFAYLSAFAGDFYAMINPWMTIISGLEGLGARFAGGRFSYPAWLGCWPASLQYIALIWIELFCDPSPLATAVALLAYTAITILGVAAFGKAAWFSFADGFSLFFRACSRLAPVEYVGRSGDSAWKLRLRLPFAGLLREEAAGTSEIFFVLLMLSSTTYDSIQSTTAWVGLYWKNAPGIMESLIGLNHHNLQDIIYNSYELYLRAGLLIFPFIYLFIYYLSIACSCAVDREITVRRLSVGLCYSIIPLSLCYNFSHYLSFFLFVLMNLPRVLADTLGMGWGAIATGDLDSTSLNMSWIWHIEVAVLLFGHVIGVSVAHAKAVELLRNRWRAAASQLPILLLMIAYTLVGLWSLALPLA